MFNPHSNWTVSLDSTKVALVAWTRARHKLMQRLGGKRLQFAIENGPVEIVDLPSYTMVIFYSHVIFHTQVSMKNCEFP
jgi:hypothetical protein